MRKILSVQKEMILYGHSVKNVPTKFLKLPPERSRRESRTYGMEYIVPCQQRTIRLQKKLRSILRRNALLAERKNTSVSNMMRLKIL